MKYKYNRMYGLGDIGEAGCFNKNKVVAQWCLDRRNVYNIHTVVETGTYMAKTTEFLVKAFKKVYTIDIFEGFSERAQNNLSRHNNLECLTGKSTEMLESVCRNLNHKKNVLFFLDAHGNYISDAIKMGFREDEGQDKAYYTEEFNADLCPAKQEIEIIAKYFKNRCVIIVDDIFNPLSPESGHINFGGVRFDYEYLRGSIEKCYDGPYKYGYICGRGLGWPKSVLTIEPCE